MTHNTITNISATNASLHAIQTLTSQDNTKRDNPQVVTFSSSMESSSIGGRTERVIIASTAAGEYIALSRGHAACKFLKTIMQFYGHIDVKAYLYTDNQSAEHIATQPNMNEHSRSIDIRHHAVRQDYLEGNVDVGGVRTDANPSDILTKYLPAPTHITHACW
jgi:hypothetical protein